jgi:uncharacterized protein YlaI
MTYTIYSRPGWHGEAYDPVIDTTESEREAAMLAGCRIDIHMPGACNKHNMYALDEDGNRVEPIESFRCDACGELTEWGESGPVGAMDDRILECPQAAEKHLVTWLCDDCAENFS